MSYLLSGVMHLLASVASGLLEHLVDSVTNFSCPGRQPQQKPAAGYPRLLTLFPNAKTGDTATSVNNHHFALCREFHTVAKEGEHK